jgi:hypothetical protein
MKKRAIIAADFPPGTSEKWVQAGTLLGYQGNYLDPSPYLGLPLNASQNNGRVVVCQNPK